MVVLRRFAWNESQFQEQSPELLIGNLASHG
jgi:hypothetical protein